MKNTVITIAAVLALSATCVRADMTGASDAAIIAKLTYVYNVLKDQYANQIELIRQAKIQSESVVKVKEFAVTAKREYEFSRNFDLERELAQIQDDIAGLSLLDNMDGADPQRLFDLLMREIDNRFEDDDSEAGRAARRKLTSHLASIKRLNELQDTKAEEAQELAAGEMSEKESGASVASSCALMAALELSREQRRIEQEMQDIDEQREKERLDDAYRDVLEKMSEEE
jgi:hypothetical protein